MEIPVIHLSNVHSVWNTDTQGPWVSKIDLVEFELCGYRYYLAHRQGKTYREFRTTSSLQLLLSRQAHEQSVDFNIPIVETQDVEVARTAWVIQD